LVVRVLLIWAMLMLWMLWMLVVLLLALGRMLLLNRRVEGWLHTRLTRSSSRVQRRLQS
jgi:hypothetical protein